MQETTAYTTGPLNQYTAIERGEESVFEPVHDADGNQTLIRTSTGIWQVAYNAENRPVRFVNESAKTVVECTYDYMGRRHTRKVSVNGTVSSYLRYMYRGYLQIAAIDAVSGVFRWFLFWDPTQPEAKRPLAIRKDGAWYAYGLDLTGNVTGIFGKAGYLRTVYTYTPYGEAAAEGDVTQPIQWSSEYNDEELGLVYYNYRHLNPHDGRWISRDPIEEEGGWNLFAFVGNKIFNQSDILGLICTIEYSIKLHTILIRKVDKDSNILRLTTSRVFSGNGDGKNNPDNVGNKDNGPIPPGKYYVIKRQSGGIRSQIKDWTYKLWNDNDKNQ